MDVREPMSIKLVPPEVNELLESQLPGRDNSGVRHQVRLVCSVVAVWEQAHQVAIRGRNAHECEVVEKATAIMRKVYLSEPTQLIHLTEGT